jgi:hypothetical protein
MSKLVVRKVTIRLSMVDTEITVSGVPMCFYVSFDSINKFTSLKNLSLFMKHINMY